MPLSTIPRYQKYILTPTVYVEVGQASPPPTDLLRRPSAPPGNAQTRFLKKQNICYMVESMFFDLTLANVAIVDWICWKAGSLEQNQLL